MEKDVTLLVGQLEKLRDRDDRAALARLRRGLGKRLGTPQMYPYVIPWVGKERSKIECGILVASLFALHPDPAPRGRSMGSVFRQMLDGNNQDSLERRFSALLSSSVQDVGGHLRHAVSLAKSKDVHVDYDKLFKDLQGWSHPDRYVQLNWARDFWTQASESETTTKTQGE